MYMLSILKNIETYKKTKGRKLADTQKASMIVDSNMEFS
jgi:hypothetical protein